MFLKFMLGKHNIQKVLYNMYKKMIHFPIVMLYLETMTPSCHELLIHLSQPGINSEIVLKVALNTN
jgi:hypothetical protein